MTKLDEVREIGARIKRFRDRLPPDSPLSGIAYKLAALTGEIEAVIGSTTTESVTSENWADEAPNHPDT